MKYTNRLKQLLVFISIFYSQHNFACDIDKEALYGGFIHNKGETLLESFALEKDGRFNSWLHDRPDFSGTWTLTNCSVVISGVGSPYPTKMTLIEITADQLLVQFHSLNNRTYFKRAH